MRHTLLVHQGKISIFEIIAEIIAKNVVVDIIKQGFKKLELFGICCIFLANSKVSFA